MDCDNVGDSQAGALDGGNDENGGVERPTGNDTEWPEVTGDPSVTPLRARPEERDLRGEVQRLRHLQTASAASAHSPLLSTGSIGAILAQRDGPGNTPPSVDIVSTIDAATVCLEASQFHPPAANRQSMTFPPAPAIICKAKEGHTALERLTSTRRLVRKEVVEPEVARRVLARCTRHRAR
mmetsp:Transcript_45458/g.114395  ORF Transcript_45458/g.114395 Transcript_45458/m.114395 type:complete len:181 (+) Transcript_45458:203-745(+)